MERASEVSYCKHRSLKTRVPSVPQKKPHVFLEPKLLPKEYDGTTVTRTTTQTGQGTRRVQVILQV